MISNMRHRLSLTVVGHKYPNVWVMGVAWDYMNVPKYLLLFVKIQIYLTAVEHWRQSAHYKLWLWIISSVVIESIVCIFSNQIFLQNGRRYPMQEAEVRVKRTSFHYHCRGANTWSRPISMNPLIKTPCLHSSRRCLFLLNQGGRNKNYIIIYGTASLTN